MNRYNQIYFLWTFRYWTLGKMSLKKYNWSTFLIEHLNHSYSLKSENLVQKKDENYLLNLFTELHQIKISAWNFGPFYSYSLKSKNLVWKKDENYSLNVFKELLLIKISAWTFGPFFLANLQTSGTKRKMRITFSLSLQNCFRSTFLIELSDHSFLLISKHLV